MNSLLLLLFASLSLAIQLPVFSLHLTDTSRSLQMEDKLQPNMTLLIVDKVEKYFAAFNSPDCEAFSKLFSEQGALLECGGIDSAIGRENIQKMCSYETVWKHIMLVPSTIFVDTQNGGYRAYTTGHLTGLNLLIAEAEGETILSCYLFNWEMYINFRLDENLFFTEIASFCDAYDYVRLVRQKCA